MTDDDGTDHPLCIAGALPVERQADVDGHPLSPRPLGEELSSELEIPHPCGGTIWIISPK